MTKKQHDNLSKQLSWMRWAVVGFLFVELLTLTLGVLLKWVIKVRAGGRSLALLILHTHIPLSFRLCCDLDGTRAPKSLWVGADLLSLLSSPNPEIHQEHARIAWWICLHAIYEMWVLLVQDMACLPQPPCMQFTPSMQTSAVFL